MRLPKLILLLALLATLLPGCALLDTSAGTGDGEVDASVDAVTDARALTASECDHAHREAIHRCQILFHPGSCYEETEAAYRACLGAVPPAAE